MLHFLPAPLQGSILFVALAINTVLCSLAIYVTALARLLIPLRPWRTACIGLSNAIAQGWVGFNSLGLNAAKLVRWDVQGLEGLQPHKWYLLMANHQSMVDIVVLQTVFHRKIPLLKFFIKKELIWVPIIGLAWWALDFPFMKRNSKASRDLDTARKACEKFGLLPVTVMNFVEGTRFTPAKRESENLPYTHLLKPKTGGMTIVLSALGRQLHAILDVTIAYPGGVPGLWSFLCGNSIPITVRVKQIPITPELLGEPEDRNFRRRFKDWMDKVWEEKDKLLGTLSSLPGDLENDPAPPAGAHRADSCAGCGTDEIVQS